MDTEIKTLFDAALELEDLEIKLQKVKVMLENVMDVTDNYARSDKVFAQVADSTYIRTFTDVADDYVWITLRKMELLIDFLYKEHSKSKNEKVEALKKVS